MTAKKTITIDVPDGVPDGWECVGCFLPQVGEMYYSKHGWVECSGKCFHTYFVARRTETAADWANKQPKLGAFASMVEEGSNVFLCDRDRHMFEDLEGNESIIKVESPPSHHRSKTIIAESGKWVNA